MLSPAKKLAEFHRTHRRMPSYAEIMGLFGYKSKNSVSKLLKRLERDGFIKIDPTGRIIPNKLLGTIKVLGTVEAGWPSPAEEELVDTITLDEWLISNKEATYMLKAKGDSMIDAGIMEGDLVLVDRSKTARDGDIVIAEIDGGWTMKYLKKQGQNVSLIPANKKYRPIIPKNDLKIAAVVIAVIRKLQ